MRYANNKIVPEAGDWVTQLNDTYSFIPHTTLVTKNINDQVWVRHNSSMDDSWLNSKEHNRDFRPATQEEIDKALGNEKIMIGEYEVKFLGDDNCRDGSTYKIKVACQEVSKETFLKIGNKAGWL